MKCECCKYVEEQRENYVKYKQRIVKMWEKKIMANVNKNLKLFIQGTLGKWTKILKISKFIFWLSFSKKSW